MARTINLRRLRQWFAWPDAARSPWERRLVCGVPFVLVFVCVVAWRGSQPTLGEDVELVGVSREEATVFVGMVNKKVKEDALDQLMHWRLRESLQTLRSERVIRITLESDGQVEVTTSDAPGEGRTYYLSRDDKGWLVHPDTGIWRRAH